MTHPISLYGAWDIAPWKHTIHSSLTILVFSATRTDWQSVVVLGGLQTGSGDWNLSCGKVKVETSWQVVTLLNTLFYHIFRTQEVDTGNTHPAPTLFEEEYSPLVVSITTYDTRETA